MNAVFRPLPWILALALLQPAWYLWLSPPAVVPPTVATIVMLAPILPALLLGVMRRPSAGFWGGLAALLYFSHGVMELWSNARVTTLAWVEILLAVGLVFAASWRGLQARRAKARGAAAPAPQDTPSGQ